MTNKPNILLITSDQHHWQALGINNPYVQTPNLDRLAASGMVLTRAYCTNPTCTPCRASIITGKMPSQHGAWSLGTKLPENEHTVGEDFTTAGYRTALVGKAHFQPLASTPEYPSLEAYPVLQHLDFWRDFHGPFYGFDHVELARNHTDEAHVGQHYALWMEEKGLTDWRRHFKAPTGETRGQKYSWSLPEEFHYNAWIAERTNALISEFQAAASPFLMWASFFDPHPSYLVPEPWASMYDPATVTVPAAKPGEHERNPPHFALTQQAKPDFSWYRDDPPDGNPGVHGFSSHLRAESDMRRDIATYYGMVSCMDHYIGKILDHLEHEGLLESTLIVFTTDHGHFHGQHGLVSKGAFHYEDMIRVPFLASWPDKIPANTSTPALLSLADLAPTFLSACGLPIPRSMSGMDQTDVLFGNVPRLRDSLLVENRHQPTRMNAKTYVDDRYKLTVYMGQAYGELFDLEEDPNELENLWDSQAHTGLKQDLLLRFIQAGMTAEPLWMPRIACA